MYDSAPSAVLRCELCNKPFDKPSTLKRHGYYCRSRRVGTVVRTRSCIACAKGKARCDTRRPECSRCLAKSIECHYPVIQRKAASAKASLPSLPADTNPPAPIEDVNEVLDPIDASNSITDLDVENFNWADSDIIFSEFLDPSVTDVDAGIEAATADVAMVHHSTPSTSTTIHLPEVAISAALNFSLPPALTQDSRSLVPRSKSKPGAHRVAALIQHTLKSYPHMMLHDGTLPPYIHPHLVSPNFTGNDMESLNNCITLVRMISGKERGSRKLFWKNVRLECERMTAQAAESNHWELLAAMHALSIYILLRMSEGETEYNNFDHLLLTTMAVRSLRCPEVTATHLTRNDLTYTPNAHACNVRACWLEWIYMESRRRLGIVYRVLNLIVYFDPGAMCSLQSDLILAPLPAKRSLWEAPDEVTWKVERDKQPWPRTAFGLAANGELVRLDEMDLYGGYGTVEALKDDKSSDQNWEEWCAGMDSFGGLVMLAASQVG